MRSLFIPALAICAAGLFSTSAVGQAPAPAKVAVVNINKAISDTAEIKKFLADLQAKYKTRQDTLGKAQQELQDLQTQWNNSQGKLSASGEADLQSKAQRQKTKVDRLTEDLQADVEAEREEAIRKVGTRMQEVLKKMTDEKGLDLIVDSAASLFTRNTLDLTDQAVAAYDKAYPSK